MSIPAIKSVEVGLGKNYATISGHNSHDEIYFDNKYKHKTNTYFSFKEQVLFVLTYKSVYTKEQIDILKDCVNNHDLGGQIWTT